MYRGCILLDGNGLTFVFFKARVRDEEPDHRDALSYSHLHRGNACISVQALNRTREFFGEEQLPIPATA
jgi:hypothetical protein